MKRIRYLTLLWMLFCGIVSWAQDWNPTSPSEPGQLTYKLKLKISPDGAGSASGGGDILPGASVTVNASAYTGWEFKNWTDAEGHEVSTTRSYTFTKAAKSETLTANFTFNPSGPTEPSELPYKLTLVTSEGGNTSGGGFYLTGTAVNIRASSYSNYDFDGWYNADGTLYSSDASTTYTMGDGPTTLTAKFIFNPLSPSEPNEVNIWRLKLLAQDGGSVYAQNYNLKEGETTRVTASTNSGYVFMGWYEGDTKISELASFDYTMGDHSVTLVAHFQFQPSNPGEPGQIQQRKFSFSLKNVISKPGATVQFPIQLTPLATLGDITFQLNFDPRLNLDYENPILGETTTPYTVSRVAVTPEDEAYDEGFTSYRYTLTGGSMVVGEDETPTVTAILTFPITLPSDIETATSYRITINQISMTNADGSTQTAGTKNGLLSVYKNGDANGDNVVDTQDAIKTVQHYLKKNPTEFIEEVADANDDTVVDTQDVIKITRIYLKKE